MKSTLAILAAAATLVFANTATAPVAEAGGVRLQFGFPLGSFVASPRSGGSSNSYASHHRPQGHHNAYAARQRAAAAAQARREAIAAARQEAAAKAKREALAEAHRNAAAQAKREAAAEARRDKLAAERAESRRLARLETEREENKPVVAAVATETSLAPDAVPAPSRPELVARADTAVPQPAKPVDTVAVAATPVKTEVSKGALDCKRFIPSAGLTVTVPCTQ